jgi:Cdc6-like AAA superfamily ATPase
VSQDFTLYIPQRGMLPQRMQKYTDAWDAKTQYTISIFFINTVLLRFFPQIKTHAAVTKMRAQFDIPMVNSGRQFHYIDDFGKEKCVILAGPMGSGKTFVTTHLIKKNFKRKRDEDLPDA